MNEFLATLLTHLINQKILDKISAAKIEEVIKEDSHKVLGELLLENDFITKDALLLLVIDFFKKAICT